jgi:quinohemoprotein ethanol dehydrogenase
MLGFRRQVAGLLTVCFLISTQGLAATEFASESAIDTGGANWASGGRGYDEQHYSPLSQINLKNVSHLGLAWSLDLPGEHTLEATPIAVDGVLYFSGQMARVYAVEASSGKELWTYDPESYKVRPGHQRLLFAANRGVAYWNDRIFVGTLDGRLVALDAKSGREVWTVQTLDPKSKSYIAGQPRTFDGKVVIGNGGADYGDRGYLTAYDAATGRQVWRVYTAPGDPARAAGTISFSLPSWPSMRTPVPTSGIIR